MTIIAAFYWEPKKIEACISYMFLGNQYKIIKEPERIILASDKKANQAIDNFLKKAFQNLSSQKNLDDDVFVEYKTVIERSRKAKPRKDSVHIDEELKKLIEKNRYQGKKIAKKLAGQELVFFKKALFKLGKVNRDESAWVYHLWAVALHATKKTWREEIKKLWKTSEGIERMDKASTEKFAEFIRQVTEK